MGRNSTVDLVIVLATVWYALRLLRPQALPVATLWALPALMLGVCLWQSRLFAGAAPASVALAGSVGVLAGLAVGRLTFRRADGRAGTVVVQGTPLSVVLWPGAIAAALGARYALGDRADPGIAGVLEVGLLAYLVGNAGAQRAYLWWRYNRTAGR
jgi:hypothetical protein